MMPRPKTLGELMAGMPDASIDVVLAMPDADWLLCVERGATVAVLDAAVVGGAAAVRALLDQIRAGKWGADA